MLSIKVGAHVLIKKINFFSPGRMPTAILWRERREE
jgi:hypothetical protein